MRCCSCNKELTDFEATRRYANEPRAFLDLCNECFRPVANDILVIEREDLKEKEELTSDFEQLDEDQEF